MKMRVKAGFLALLLTASLMSGCGSPEKMPEPGTKMGGEVMIETFLLPETSAVTTVTEDTYAYSETSCSSTMTEAVTLETEEFSEQPEIQSAGEYEFPQEFYDKLSEILSENGLNPDCDGSYECSCEPEKEETDSEGNVTEPRKKALSIYFKDISSGGEFILNPGAHYPIASTVKIPFCVLIYKKIESGEIDPEQVLVYEKRHYFEGTGEIVKGDFGQEFTVAELLELAITVSDNVAYEMLKDLVSWDEFSEYLSENGCSHPEDIRKSKQKICCESAGAYGRVLSEYLTSDGEYVEKFKEDLLNTRLKMIVSSYPVYRKYGWAGFSFHDIAYVDAPKPYILAILSNLENNDNEDLDIFRDISELFEEYTGNSPE